MKGDVTPETSELVLLERLRAGDLEVLSELFARHRPRLLRMVQFRIDPRLATRLDADDVLQESWIAARQRIRFWLEAPEKSFYVWLRLVTGQTLVDIHRRHLGAQMRDLRMEVSIQRGGGGPPATSVSLAGHLLANMTSPSQAAMQAELSARLSQALDSMDEIDREILVLRHFEEPTNNEVAELLGMKKSATSNRYVRALGRLKGILEGMPGFVDGVRSDPP